MLIDKPIAELRTYLGSSPLPKDFDRYWDESLAELETIPANVELIPAAFQSPNAECFDLYFTGIGNARIHAKLLRPVNPKGKHPAVVQFHGYSANAGDWCDKLNFVSAGFTVASLDTRGQGGLSQDLTPVSGTTLKGHIIRGVDDPDPKKLLFRSNFLDTARLTRIVMQMDDVDASKVGAMGGSQGGGLTLACASLVPELNRAVSVFPFLSDYRRVWNMDLAKNAYDEIQYYFRHFDPTHAREEEFFTRLGYIDVQNLAPRIRCRVFMVTGLMDTICPPSTQFAAFNKITSPKEHVFYPDFGHEGLPENSDRIFQFMLDMLK
ncbi:MAG: acetylxylan esterase [Victivallales bacterium]|jgi:cephalosporin-C deacetylase|nr:acetylxylan esterase [Victivallales bacterium]